MSFASWVSDLLPGSDQKRVDELAKKGGDAHTREQGLQQDGETYFGTNVPVKDEHDVQVKQTTAGTEKKEESGWSWLSDTWKRVSGETTKPTQEKPGTSVTTSKGSTTEVDPSQLTATSSTNQATSVKVVDIQGMGGAAVKELEAKKLDDNTTDDDRARIDAAITKLKNPELDEATLKQIVTQEQLRLRTQYKEVASASTTTKDSVDVRGGSAGTTTTTSKSTANADGTTTTTTNSDGTKVVAGQGALNVSNTQGSSTQTTRGAPGDGVVTDGTSKSSTTSGGLVGGDKGHGLGVGQTKDSSQTKNDVTDKKSTSLGGQVTDKGVYAQGSQTTTKGLSETASVQQKVSADGSFTVTITPVAGSAPPQYQVVMIISASAGASLKLAQERSAKASAAGKQANTGSASAEAKLGASLTFTHVMDADEARQYMTNVDKVDKGGPAAPAPEFGVIGKLRALAKEGGGVGVGAASVLGGSQAATMLKDGESVDLVLTADERAGLSGARGNGVQGDGAVGVSAEASGGTGQTRAVKITRTADSEAQGKHMVDVTVTFATRQDAKVALSGSAEGVTVGGTHSSGSSESEGATVRLDVDSPDYSEKFKQVCAAVHVQDVRALATQFQKSQTQTANGGGSVGAGGGAVNFNVTSTTSDTTNVDKNAQRVTGTEAGGQTMDGSVSAGSGDKSVKVAQDKRTDTATTTVDKQGSETNLETKQEKSDAWRSAKDGASSAWGTVSGWFSSNDKSKESKAGSIADAATTSPQEKLKAQVETTYADLERYQLSEHDVETVVQRASDGKSWSTCNSSPYYMAPWEALRNQLLSPPIKPDEAAVNQLDARRLALGRVMAQGMASGGSRAMSSIICVLRHWQQGDVFADKALGVHFEWPESLKATRAMYDDVHQRGRMADDILNGFNGKKDAESRGRAWYDDTAKGLDTVKSQVSASGDVTPGAKMEMVAAFQKERQDLDHAWERHLPALKGAPAAASKEPAAPLASPQPEPATQVPDDEKKQLWRQLTDLTALLGQYHSEEQSAYARAKALLPVNAGGDKKSSWDEFWKTNWNQAQDILSEIGLTTHTAWIERIKQLRSLYEKLGVPQAEWVVTSAGAAPRKANTEPDVVTLNFLSTRSDGVAQHNFNLDARQSQADQWLKRWRSY